MNPGADSVEMVLVNAPTTNVEDYSSPAHRASSAAVYRFVHDRVQQAAALLLSFSPENTLTRNLTKACCLSLTI